MQYDDLTLRLTCFLTWITILSSSPTNTYFHTWHDGPDSYRLSPRSFMRRNDEGYEGQVLPLLGQRKGETNVPTNRETFIHVHNSGYHREQVWYPFGEKPSNPNVYYPQPQQQQPQTGYYPPPPPAPPQNEFRRSDEVSSRSHNSDTFRSKNGDYYTGNAANNNGNSYGVQNFDNTYSGHAGCQVDNQNESEVKSPKVPQRTPEEEKIKFEETSRPIRNGSSREVDTPDLRVVTPKGGSRRPTQASGEGGKHGGTNVVISTATTFRNQTQKGSKRPRPNGGKPHSGDIIFPDVYHRTSFTPRASECGKKSTFCENIGDDYPRDYINQILKKEGAMFREFFGKDVIMEPNITERIHAPEENSLCPYQQNVIYPQKGKNSKDKWRFIINQDQYIQAVIVEVCLNPGSRCTMTEGFPLGYTPYCKQKRIMRRLISLNESGKPQPDTFEMPSCCSCVVKHDSSARMAPRTSRETSPAETPKPPIHL